MKINIQNYFKSHKTNHKTKIGQTRFVDMIGNDSFVDWVIILSASCVIAVILIGVGSFVYVNTQAELGVKGVAPLVNRAYSFDTQKLKKVIDAFDARANERVLLSKGYTGPSDPSLP